MSKKGSLKYEMKKNLQSMARYGHSKHADKAANGGKPAMDKIYSRQTMATYKQVADEYSSWCRSKGIKTMEQAEAATGDYLRQRMGDCSAWTVRRDAAALGKLFQKPTTELGVALPSRTRANIVRSRSMPKGFSEKKNQSLVDLCKASGLRRSEVQNLTPEQVFLRDGKCYIDVKGKGGKERKIECLSQKPYELAQKAIQEGRSKVIDHVPHRAPCHVYRAEYAQALYEKLPKTGIDGAYQCRGDRSDSFDRAAMMEVSQNLGHSRLDVVISYMHTISLYE